MKSLGYISGTNLGDFKTQRDDRLQRFTFRKRLEAFKTSERTFELRNTLSIFGRPPRASKDSHSASASHCRKSFQNIRTHFRNSKHPLDLWKTPSSFGTPPRASETRPSTRMITYGGSHSGSDLNCRKVISKRWNALLHFERTFRNSEARPTSKTM